MDKLYLATIEISYNNDKLYYLPCKRKYYLLKNNLFLEVLNRKVSNGAICYKEKGSSTAYYLSKMKKNAKKCNIEFPIGLPCPF